MNNQVADSLQVEFSDNNILSSLFGVYDSNILLLEKMNNVKIEYRGNIVKISGHKLSIQETKIALEKLFDEAKKGIEIDEEKIKDTKSLLSWDMKDESQLDFFIQTKKRKIIPRSQNQKKYIELLNNKIIVFAIGPAGTGKTFLAVAKAVSSLQKGLVKKIILSRPAVEAGEKLGFLPGDMKDKVDPYLRPLYDSLYDLLDYDKIQRKIESGAIEIAPLAFMRGRTLKNSFAILDEAQNATETQIKMFLTRIGENSKLVVNGDPSQVDLTNKNQSGLIKSQAILKGIKEISVINFDHHDVMRHPLVTKIVEAYQKNTNDKG